MRRRTNETSGSDPAPVATTVGRVRMITLFRCARKDFCKDFPPARVYASGRIRRDKIIIIIIITSGGGREEDGGRGAVIHQFGFGTFNASGESPRRWQREYCAVRRRPPPRPSVERLARVQRKPRTSLAVFSGAADTVRLAFFE